MEILNRIYIKEQNIITLLFFLIFLTSSFDIFLNLKIAGYNIRILFFFELILLLFIIKNYFKNKIHTFRLLNWPFLFIWFLFIVVFIPHTTILTRNIGYVFWLFLSILLVGILQTLIKDKNNFYKLFNYYIFSFFFVAIFALIQFISGLFGISLLTTQWWIKDSLPRINAFNYEPSYFGSYMLIGWSLLLYLIFKSNYYAKKYKLVFLFFTVIIILSSSRMAILSMGLAYLSLISFLFFKELILKFRIKTKYIKWLLIFLIIIGISVYLFVKYFSQIMFLLSGVGIGGTSAHSSQTRISQMIDTLTIFFNSPFIGYSLGGIPSAIAKLHGNNIYTQIDAKQYEGMNIFFEVLAASGIFGYVFFVLFFILLFYKAISISKKLTYIDCKFSLIIRALTFSLFWEMFILSMNQNILRPYFWIAIGMLSSSIFIGRKILNESKI